MWLAVLGVRLSNNWKVIDPKPLMLNCTLLLVCGMTMGVTVVGLDVVAPKLTVLPDGSLPFRATSIAVPAGKVRLEIAFKPTEASSRRSSRLSKPIRRVWQQSASWRDLSVPPDRLFCRGQRICS